MDSSLENQRAEKLKLIMENLKHNVEKRRRLRNVIVVVPAFFGLFILLALPFLDKQAGMVFFFNLFVFKQEVLVSLAFGLLMLSGANILMGYLQTGFKRNSDEEVSSLKLKADLERLRTEAAKSPFVNVSQSSDSTSDIKSLRAEMSELKTQLHDVGKEQISALAETLKKEISAEAGNSLISDLQKKVTEEVITQTHEREIARNFEETRNRLSLEIAALGRRGNLNLILGIFTTVSGLILLAMFVFTQIEMPKEAVPFAMHFLPRLTLVLFIQIFAYFFLRLYKSSLAEIKYFQNELTNVEQKHVALITAIKYGESVVRNEVISKFASTERNHVLEKDQTTVELEKSRIEKESLSEVAKHMADMLSKKS